MTTLQDKIILITGGNSGIGLATAHRCVKLGARVIIGGRDQATLTRAQQELGPRAVAVRGDVLDPATRKSLINAAHTLGGRIDAIFLNAGIAKPARLEDITEQHIDETLNTNFKSVLLLIRDALPLLGSGSTIILNGSWLASVGTPSLTMLSASKAAIRSITRTLAAELAPRGIRVNVVSPGAINTPIHGKMGLPPEQLQAVAQGISSQIPLGRFGTADEIASMVTFLASADSSYITGAEFLVDGGFASI